MFNKQHLAEQLTVNLVLLRWQTVRFLCTVWSVLTRAETRCEK